MAGYASHKTMSGMSRMANKLTPQEKEIISVSFESFSEETIEDGVKCMYIDSDKLREAFAGIGASGDVTDIQLLIDDIDENGDGRIDRDEWTAIMSRKFLGEEDDSSFMHVFQMLDDNKDGYIPLVELRKLLMQEGQAPLSEQEVDELLMFADLDSDGLVNYRTFLRWLSAPDAYAKAQRKAAMDAAARALAEALAATPQNAEVIADRIQDARFNSVDQETLDEAQRILDQLKGRPGKQPTKQPEKDNKPKPKGPQGNDTGAGVGDLSNKEEESKIKQIIEAYKIDAKSAKDVLDRADGDLNAAFELLLS